MSVVLVLLSGAVIGLVLGALGGGGSILAVPALVYVLGESARDATTTSLVVVGITSAVGAVGYHRDKRVRWGTGFAFGLAGIAASFAGTTLNQNVTDGVLLTAFAAVMAVSAVGMLSRAWRSRSEAAKTAEGDKSSSLPESGAAHAGSSTLLKDPTIPTKITRYHVVTGLQVIGAGLLVGFLTGFLGVGGGFIVVPVLVMILGYSMPVAAGTSLLIIAINSAVSLTIRASSQPHFDWAIIVPFTIAAVLASQAGRRLAGHASSTVLSVSFAVVILMVAAGIGIETALLGTNS